MRPVPWERSVAVEPVERPRYNALSLCVGVEVTLDGDEKLFAVCKYAVDGEGLLGAYARAFPTGPSSEMLPSRT